MAGGTSAPAEPAAASQCFPSQALGLYGFIFISEPTSLFLLLAKTLFSHMDNRDVSIFKPHCTKAVVLSPIPNNSIVHGPGPCPGPGTGLGVCCKNRVTFSFWK